MKQTEISLEKIRKLILYKMENAKHTSKTVECNNKRMEKPYKLWHRNTKTLITK
jgi:uncharacterized protein with ParB-like and HNH nuclease domain